MFNRKLYDWQKGEIDHHICDLLDEYLVSDDEERKKSILCELVPGADEQAIEDFVKKAEYDCYAEKHFEQKLMDTEDELERHRMIDEQLGEDLKNGVAWVKERQRVMYQIPYFPLDEKQKKLYDRLRIPNFWRDNKYKCEFEYSDDLPLRDRMAAQLMESAYAMTMAEAYEFADALLPIKKEEAKAERERERNKVREEKTYEGPYWQTTDSYLWDLELNIGNIPRAIAIRKMHYPDKSKDEIRMDAHRLPWIYMLHCLIPEYYVAKDMSYEEFWEDEEGESGSGAWKTRKAPAPRYRGNKSMTAVYLDIFKELIYCIDYDGGMNYARALYPELPAEVIADMVTKSFNETGNLYDSPAEKIHRHWLKMLLQETETMEEEEKSSDSPYWGLRSSYESFFGLDDKKVLAIDDKRYIAFDEGRNIWVSLNDRVVYSDENRELYMQVYAITDGQAVKAEKSYYLVGYLN